MIHTIKKNIWVGLLASTVLLSAAPATQAADDYAAIKQRLQTIIPTNANNAVITKSAIPGLYQIQLGMTVVYMSKDGKFLVNGSMVDLDTQTNLTRKAQAEARKIALKAIPEETMIIYPGKEGKKQHTITVFSDIDCPYCVKLHKEIPQLNEAGVTVRYISYPRAGVNSPSYKKAVSVWCADDKKKAMDEAMSGKTPASKTCKNPVKEHIMQAEIFEVNGTPNIILEDGNILPGYVPAKKLIQMLNAS
ncbi:DsbC family protein [Thiomicrorhabdus sp.]|uniref:DsbC family protein n=1 Tax=Thiomicrorhabdus sp. TaxID=2039724 RepID=UPI002AA731CB|nr:DsbC family protein [Thiomicrorhabdus sp.]